MADAEERAEIAAQHARLGAMLASKGLSPDQVATLMRDHVQPVLEDGLTLIERGEDIANLQFEIRPADPAAPARFID